MATAAVLAPHGVPTSLNYYTPIGTEEPYQYVLSPPAGKEPNNIGLDPRDVTVHDARGRESEFSLDTNGFQFVNYPSVEKEFDDDERIKEVYYPEVEKLLKDVAGAKRVFIFDHTLRRKPDPNAAQGPTNRGPVERVHIDQTYNASVERVKHHLPEDAARLLQSRVRIINVWRPIHHPVAHKPLAVSDWRHLDEKDLVSVHFIYPHRTGSTYSVRYNPAHRWWHLAGQTPDEVTLIKCYDSETDRARLTPHSAFADASSPAEAPHRESIEVRALVFDSE
uniref:N/A n=1 Tax=Ganoderma boninense TaxID=34458 RepID=A0A5K1K1Q8_9APHY|nr:N/A [Ganoderma boninense]